MSGSSSWSSRSPGWPTHNMPLVCRTLKEIAAGVHRRMNEFSHPAMEEVRWRTGIDGTDHHGGPHFLPRPAMPDKLFAARDTCSA
jgi:hypothetical protein